MIFDQLVFRYVAHGTPREVSVTTEPSAEIQLAKSGYVGGHSIETVMQLCVTVRAARPGQASVVDSERIEGGLDSSPAGN